MRHREEREEVGPPLCDRCGEEREKTELQICSFCQKNFCRWCAIRMGDKEYCSRSCAQAMFFSGDDDEDALNESD